MPLTFSGKQLNEHIIYYSLWNLSSLFHNPTYLWLSDSFLFLSTLKNLKNLSNYFLRWVAYKSFLSRFSVLIDNTMWFTIQFFFWHPAISNVIHGPGFSGTMFFRIQLFQGRSFFKVQIFQGQVFTFQGFSRFGSRIRVQVLEVAK